MATTELPLHHLPASWSFSSHIDISDNNGNEDGSGKDDSSSDGEGDDDADDDHDDGSSTPPSSPPPDPPSGTSGFLPRGRQSLTAARACIALTRHLVTVWRGLMDVGGEADAVTEAGDSQRLIPLMQTTFTLCRLLEAVAQCSELPEPEEDLMQTAYAARFAGLIA